MPQDKPGRLAAMRAAAAAAEDEPVTAPLTAVSQMPLREFLSKQCNVPVTPSVYQALQEFHRQKQCEDPRLTFADTIRGIYENALREAGLWPYR